MNRKFKIGDKVRTNQSFNTGVSSRYIGQILTIKAIEERIGISDAALIVEWNNNSPIDTEWLELALDPVDILLEEFNQ